MDIEFCDDLSNGNDDDDEIFNYRNNNGQSTRDGSRERPSLRLRDLCSRPIGYAMIITMV